MPPPDAARDLYLTLQRLQLVLLGLTRRAWSGMGRDFDSSWGKVAPELTTLVAAGQLAAARSAVAYVPAVLAETGLPDDPDARVRPQAFSGVAADGRSLTGLLYGGVGRAKAASRTRIVEDEDGHRHVLLGKPPDQALDQGGRWLETIVHTAVADAARMATTAEIATREGLGFVRMLNPPCCPRCAMLAGRWYRYDAGFKRHPGCDCSLVPSTDEGWQRLSISPDELFDSGQVRGLTQREQARLAAGEDRNKVINESRDMWRARQAEQRRTEREEAKAAARGEAAPPLDPVARDRAARQGLEDIFASTRSRIEAVNAMKAQGFTD